MPAPGRRGDRYKLITEFKGYLDSFDVTKMSPEYMIRGSKNVLVKDKTRIVKRNGYEFFGQSATVTASDGMGALKTFINNEGDAKLLRATTDNSGELQVYESTGWHTLTALDNPLQIFYAKNLFWNVGELTTEQLFVDNTAKTYAWNGATTTIASATATTLTKEGTETWAEAGFYKGHHSAIRFDFTAQPAGSSSITVTFDDGSTVQIVQGTDFTNGTDIIETCENIADTFATKVDGNGAVYLSSRAALQSVFIIPTGEKGITNVTSSGSIGTTMPTLPARQIVYNGTAYTYTGGEDTTTLTGLSAFPSGSITVGDFVHQAPRSYANANSNRIPTSYTNSVVDVFQNQVHVLSENSPVAYASQSDFINDFRFSSPRLIGEGFRSILPGDGRGIFVHENSVYYFYGDNGVLRLTKRLNNNGATFYEQIAFDEQDIMENDGLLNKYCITQARNGIAYISKSKKINFLGSIRELEGLRTQTLSDPIEDLLLYYDMTGASVHYDKNQIHVAIPNEGVSLVYDIELKLWQPPQTVPVRHYESFNGDLIGAATSAGDTYKMYTGDNDLESAIESKIALAYNNYGSRAENKQANKLFVEGYMTKNTELDTSILIEYTGAKNRIARTIKLDGDSQKTEFYEPSVLSGLGKNPLGAAPLGGGTSQSNAITKPKFRSQVLMPNQHFVEMAVEFSTNDTDVDWEIISYGFAAQGSFLDTDADKS